MPSSIAATVASPSLDTASKYPPKLTVLTTLLFGLLISMKFFSSLKGPRLLLQAMVLLYRPCIAWPTNTLRGDVGNIPELNLGTSGPDFIDIVHLVAGLLAIIGFIWIVGFRGRTPSRIAAWLMVVTSCVWWAAEGNGSWDPFSKIM